MKKKWTILPLIGLIVLVLSCSAPAYQLAFEVTGWSSNSGGVITVFYDLQNVGSESLSNASVRIELTTDYGDYDYAWTPGVDLWVGETVSDSYTFYFMTGEATVAEITAVGWDVNNNNW